MTEHEAYYKSGEHSECCNKDHQQRYKECHCKEHFLMMADKAWMELLKEKIKANIEKEHGTHIEQLADILAKANGDQWKHKMEAKMCYEEYQNTLKEFFKSKK